MDNQKAAPPEVMAVVKYLRSSKAGVKIRVGVLNGKRIDYFKGKGAVKALLLPAFSKVKNAPKVENEEAAAQLLQNIMPYAFYLRVERGGASGAKGSPKHLQIMPQQMFRPEDHFAWFWEGLQWTNYLGGAAMVAVILAGVMYPLWPPTLRVGVGYLSMGLLGLIGLFIAIAIFRLIFYVITVVVASPGIWIFPQLFADVGFVESFIPFWEWDLPKKKKGKKKGKGKEKDGAGGEGEGEGEKADGAVAPVSAPAPAAAGAQQSYHGATIEEIEDDDD